MICIALITASTVTVLPANTLTLAWTHTVEGTRWEEDYAVVEGALVLQEARVKTSGAGMDAPANAVWTGEWWRYVPSLGPLHEVVLAYSAFAPGYTVCWHGTCRQLQTLIPTGNFAKMAPRPCTSTAP
jgi:hypothetical protein